MNDENRILFFGIAREIVGTSEMTMSLKGLSLASFKDQLFKQYPSLSNLKSINFALNQEYVSHDLVIQNGDEIALIPPVSGG